MSEILKKIHALGLELPEPIKMPPGVVLPFPFVNIRGNRAFISGHGPQNTDGSLAPPFGAVGAELSVEEAYQSARKTTLSILGSLNRELGELDRITGWCRVFGMVKCAPGFNQTPAVINGCTDLILELFGPEIGSHARSAIGVEALPFNIPVEIEAEVMIAAEPG